MVQLTKTPTQVLLPAGGADVKASELVTLLDEHGLAIDRAALVPPVAAGATLSITAAQNQTLFAFSGAASVALPEAGSLPAGFHVKLKAGAGALTVTPFTGDTVGGAASLTVAATEEAELYCDGLGDWLVVIIAGLGSLGSAATRNVGTAEGNLVEVLAGGRLPVLDGGNLTGTPGALLFVLEDRKAQNTNAQTVGSANSWITRDLNAETLDLGGFVSRSGNAFTPTRNCVIHWAAPGHDSNSQTRLWNVTAGEVVEMGTSANGSHAGWSTGVALGVAGQTYRIEQNFGATGTRAGLAANRGTEIYTRVIGYAR